MNLLKVNKQTAYENVGFADQMDPYLYDMESPMDPTRMLQDTNDASLENFFSRPLKIHDEEWGTGAALYFSIDPWSLYLENARVGNRMVNYNLLRSTLHIKVVCNGNGFQYGRAIASYLPFDVFDTLSVNAGAVTQDIVQASQQPHIYIDPCTSTAGEMKIPFFYHKNYLNVADTDWGDLGTLTTRSINDLKHANGASDQVTVSVFAWIENVSLNVLTSVEPNTLVPQAGSEIEEGNSKGFISGPATTVAKIAGLGKMIPAIAPFATATEAAATTVASIAKSLGYSRPPVTADPPAYKLAANSSLALTTVPDGIAKLTVDDKQELTIDPRIAGIGAHDALNIKEIAKRESFLTKFSWVMGTAPETLLWNARIDPVTWAESGGISPAFHFPACAMAALPFKFWTGTMKFRFQVVCSAFHKGRIKLVYDPNFLATNEYNTNYLQIIDLAETQDFTIEIGNGQETTLLTHHLPGLESVTQMYSTTPFASIEQGNGVVGVYVVNELTTPNSSVNNDIEINVFVSMGDDFEVFVPDDHIQAFVFKPQAGFEPQSGSESIIPESQNTTEPSAPQHEESISLGPSCADNSLVNKVYTGESIATFRTMLKRYNLHSSIGPKNFPPNEFYGRRSMFPYLRGNVFDAVDTTAANASYNYCNTVLLHWVTYAFSGWRGSIRWKILPRGFLNPNNMPCYYIQRHAVGETEFQRGQTNQQSNTSPSMSAEAVVYEVGSTPAILKPFSGMKGMHYQNGYVNPTTEFECPFYSPYRFSPGKTQSFTGPISFWTEGFDYRIWVDGNDESAFDFYCAAGEDYQAYFFTGLPRMYYESSPPAPET